MREKIGGIMRDETLTKYEKTDQIFALLCEEVEKRPNRYLIVDGTGTKYFTGPHIDAQIEAYESCRQDFLALLRGDEAKAPSNPYMDASGLPS